MRGELGKVWVGLGWFGLVRWMVGDDRGATSSSSNTISSSSTETSRRDEMVRLVSGRALRFRLGAQATWGRLHGA